MALEDETEFIYALGENYFPDAQHTIMWDDPDIGIDWTEGYNISVSKRDRQGKRLKSLLENYKLGVYNLSEEENKKFTHCFVLCKKVIPFDNNNNIKEILDSSQKNNIPGKFISIILQDPLSFMNPYWSMIRQMNNLKNLHPSEEVNDIDSILSKV